MILMCTCNLFSFFGDACNRLIELHKCRTCNMSFVNLFLPTSSWWFTRSQDCCTEHHSSCVFWLKWVFKFSGWQLDFLSDQSTASVGLCSVSTLIQLATLIIIRSIIYPTDQLSNISVHGTVNWCERAIKEYIKQHSFVQHTTIDLR